MTDQEAQGRVIAALEATTGFLMLEAETHRYDGRIEIAKTCEAQVEHNKKLLQSDWVRRFRLKQKHPA